MASIHEAHDSLSQDAAQQQGLMSVTAAKAKKEDKDKIKLTDLIDKTKATKEERDVDVDEVSADLPTDENGNIILSKDEATIYAQLSLRHEDTGADNDQIFIVDGDSLLHEILLDPLLDWSHGGQTLHIHFALEQYLRRFQEGGRIFRFVFFHSFGSAAWANSPLIQLLRERMIQHLRSLHVQVSEFQNWWSQPFAEFLERVDPAFILVGDGSNVVNGSSATSSTSPSKSGSVDALANHLAQLSITGPEATPSLPPHEIIRSLSLYLLAHHFIVIRLTELSFSSNSMYAFQFAMHSLYKRQLCEVDGYKPAAALLADTGAPTYRLAAAKSFDSKLAGSLASLDGDSRLKAVTYAITKTLAASSKDAIELCKSILIATVLVKHIGLDARALVWENADAKRNANKTLAYASTLATFHQHLLTASIGAGVDVTPNAGDLDVFDGRLVAFVLYALNDQKVSTLGWSSSMESELTSAWSLIQSTNFLPLGSLKSIASPEVTDLDEAKLADEARARVAESQTNLAQVKVDNTNAVATPVAASSSSAPPAAAASAEEEDLGNWDDEDTDEKAPAAAEEEDVGSWEDISDTEEPVVEKKSEPAAAAAYEESTSSATDAVKPAEEKALVPIVKLDNKFVADVSGALDARLAAHGLLLDADESAKELTRYSAPYAASANKVLDDGMDDAPAPVVLTNKREQRQAARMVNYWQQYSKSLVGGRLVLREVVVAAPAKDDDDDEKDEEKDSSSSKPKKGKDVAKDAKAKKAGKPGAGGGKKAGGGKVEKESIKDKIRREVEEQQRLKDMKKIQGKINIASSMSTLPAKIAKLDSELEQAGDATAIPALLQLLEWCLELWKQSKPKSEIEPAIKVFVLIHDIYRRFKQFLTPEEFKKVIGALVQLGFEDVAQRIAREFAAGSEGKYTFEQVKIDLKSSSFPATLIGLGYNRFQLEYCGPWMLRNVDSAPDERVTKFFPDAWQRNLLDVADANQSALIVAPTSAGKTFISYYVMKNVLAANKTIERSSERGVVIYVAASKSLVNQVSADVYQRYGLVFGTATDDHQDKALTSEVLITVPSVLEKLLLSPNREAWVKKIRWCIFDEVHLISSAGEGSIWERCLSLIRCPFLALSATVGNPRDFHGWLNRLDGLRGRKVHLIVHQTRWSDLEKGMYLPADPSVPPHQPENIKKFDLRTLALTTSQWASVRVHPCAAVGSQFEESSEFPKEISFSPRDSLSLFDALMKFGGTLPESLKKDLTQLVPENFFPELLINKARAMEYEERLKNTLTSWLEAGLKKEVGQVMEYLTGDLKERVGKMEGKAQVGQSCYDTAFIRKHFFSLLLELYSRDQLPGIIFSNDLELCQQLVTDTLEKLEDLEAKTLEQESTSDESKAKIKQKAAMMKQLKKKRDQVKKNKQAEEDAKDADEIDIEIEADADEYTVDPRFSFIDETEKMDKKELDYWVKRTLYKTQWKKTHPLIRALYRGIGVHHSNLVKQYRDLVETLFRGKHLKVVVATSTLALGVNMPARSVTLCGDSKLLTPLQYRQMSGRAGRRGYDNVGHVQFFAIPPRKIFRLLKSPLNSLRGAFPINNTLSLRMINYYSTATDKKDAGGALSPLLREPFFKDNFSGSQLLNQINYHYRFSLESLYQRSLINVKGQGYGLSTLATFMHAADPSNFGFVALLESGHFHEMCSKFDTDKNGVARDLLGLLAHLFYRVPVPAYLTRSNFRAGSPNMILLPPVDPKVKAIIDGANQKTLSEFGNYLKTFSKLELGKAPAAPVTEAPAPTDSSREEMPPKVYESFYQLPVSGLNFPWTWSKSTIVESSLMSSLSQAKMSLEARSPFVGTSGHDDTFETARSLAETVRNGIFLDTKLIPVCMEDLDSRGNDLQLNAYVVDFYLKQHLYSVVQDNRMSDAFLWGLLKNWSLLLNNITIALRTLSADPTKDILVMAFDHLSTTFDQYFTGIINM